jgi:hypothetical protein
MGDATSGPIRLSFNPKLRVEFRGATVTDAGLLLPRELDERLGLSALIERHLSDPGLPGGPDDLEAVPAGRAIGGRSTGTRSRSGFHPARSIVSRFRSRSPPRRNTDRWPVPMSSDTHPSQTPRR